jgi:hypothetical protein
LDFALPCYGEVVLVGEVRARKKMWKEEGMVHGMKK